MAIPYGMRPIIARLPYEAQMSVSHDYEHRRKSKLFAYLAWFFVGWHYLYLRRVGLQFAFWFTAGGLGLWWLIDLFRVGPMVNRLNEDLARELALQYGSIFRDHDPAPIVVNYASQPQLAGVGSHQSLSHSPSVDPQEPQLVYGNPRRRLPVVAICTMTLAIGTAGVWFLATRGAPVMAEQSIGTAGSFVTTRQVNVRSAPFASSKLMGSLDSGTPVTGIVAPAKFSSRRWLKLTTGPFAGGYVSFLNLQNP